MTIDPGAAGFDHRPRRCLGAKHAPFRLTPRTKSQSLSFISRNGTRGNTPGIVDENVDMAEFTRDKRDHIAHLRQITDIGLNRNRLATCARGLFPDPRRGVTVGEPVDPDIRAGCRQRREQSRGRSPAAPR